MQVFAVQGYAHTSIRWLAAQAGISTGFLYHYFESKESLLQAVFDDCMAKISAGFVRAIAANDPFARITGFVHFILDTLKGDPIFWSLFYGLRAQPTVNMVLGDAFRLWTGRLRELFVENLKEAERRA